MWSYYGSKSKVIHNYPPPQFDTIVEPFAGTARYSLYGNNWQRNVILCDKYDVIIRVWKYLQQANPEDILKLPDVKDGQPIPNSLCDEEKWLMGFCVNRGSAQPKLSASRFNDWARDRESISKQVHKIRHWYISNASYESLGNARATWFVDPPYQGTMGSYYKHHDIDFDHLAEWCKSRWGESIVCENMSATWLDFKPLVSHYGSMRRTTEAIWHSNAAVIQGNLFGGTSV